MPRTKRCIRALALVIAVTAVVTANAQETTLDGEGIDSQVLWPTPGPSNFPTVQSSDIVGHKNVSFSALFGYANKPMPMLEGPGGKGWAVKHAFTADFLWAFGIFDYAQIGLALPVILDQKGVGVTPIQPVGAEDADYVLAGSALRDLRFNVKGRFLGGKAANPDTRGLGLGLDIGLSVPTGDELNFAGDEGAVLFPTGIVDFHKCMFSAAVNLGARIRFSESEALVKEDFKIGHQGTAGLGVTGHLLDRRLLLSAEGTGLVEIDGFDRVGMEFRGGVGYIPDDARAITLWLAGGASAASETFLGAPRLRMLVSMTYAP